MNNDMSRPPPVMAMRAKMLQHLTNMGYKKDEAQRALISNNMNFESALSLSKYDRVVCM